MNCAKCGTAIPEGQNQCPSCGLVGETVAANKKTKPLVYGIVILAVIALMAIAFAVVASRGRNEVVSAPMAGPPPPGSVVSAPPGSPQPGNVVSAPPGTPAPSDVAPSSQPKFKPPKALVDYLDFVKNVEEHRQMLLKDTNNALALAAAGQAQGLLDMIDIAMDPDGAKARDPLADAKKELNRQYKNWLSTLDYFDKRSAPAEARVFSGAYRDVVYREAKAIGEIAVSFNAVNVMDPKGLSKLLSDLQKMKGDPSIQRNIDAAADNTDAKLTQLVSDYDMEKPFNVPREQGTGGSIMGF